MSLFLGKIHFWLYNKIIWAEKAEQDMIQWAKNKGMPADRWAQQNNDKYGEPAGNKPLEEIIDTSNIHGWLQERITSVELRQASLVTGIIGENPDYIKDLVGIFTAQGSEAASEYGETPDTAEGMFNALQDFILEGMPCDRVNEAVSSRDDEFIWKTTTCLHKPYWDQTAGNIQNFYTLREAWVKAFVEALNPEFNYIKLEDGMHKISKK